jgi:hypothetical protein
MPLSCTRSSRQFPATARNRTRHKLTVYAKLGIQHYRIIRGDINAEETDGVVTQYDLVDGEYEVAGQRLVTQIAAL